MKIFENNAINITQFQPDHKITMDVNYERINDEEEFDKFVENVMGYIFQRDFIIEDEYESNRNGSVSYYATFYPTDKDGDVKYKYLVFFRLSDHKSLFNKDSKLLRHQYHKDIARELKRSDDKHQEWIFRDIIIGTKAYPSYNNTLDAIADILADIQDGTYFEQQLLYIVVDIWLK